MVKFSVATVTVVNEKNVTAAKSQRLKIEGSSWWLLVFRNCVFFDVVVPSKRTLVVYNVCLISLMFRFVWQLCKTSKLPKPTKPLELTPRFWSQGSQVGSRTIAARCASKVVGMVSHGQLILVNAQVLGERERSCKSEFYEEFQYLGIFSVLIWFDFCKWLWLMSKIGLPVWSVGSWGIKWCRSLKSQQILRPWHLWKIGDLFSFMFSSTSR